MKAADAAKELFALLLEAERLGGRQASPELREFLRQLAGDIYPSLASTNGSSPRKRRVATRVPQRTSEAEMSKTIDELAKKLRDAFENDASFEAAIREPNLQKLPKPSVVSLYNRVFETSRNFPKSATKPDLFNAIRRERINRVRARS